MIICAKCGHEHPSDRIYDQWPCTTCGNLITAYITQASGKRISEDEALESINSVPERWPQNTSSLRHER